MTVLLINLAHRLDAHFKKTGIVPDGMRYRTYEFMHLGYEVGDPCECSQTETPDLEHPATLGVLEAELERDVTAHYPDTSEVYVRAYRHGPQWESVSWHVERCRRGTSGHESVGCNTSSRGKPTKVEAICDALFKVWGET